MTVFLPCRAGSQRVPHKNTKNFAGIEGGLLKHKLRTLLQVEGIDKIVVSTNDKEVVKVVNCFKDSKIEIDIRPESLGNSKTSTDDLIKYVPSIIQDEYILWTHVTSPFISKMTYEKAINIFFTKNRFDSLMTVNKIQTFLWNENEPINYNRSVEKWPRTQTLPIVYEINSGFFINTRTNYLRYNDRIGDAPFLFITEGYESLDIDWPNDFLLAELIYKGNIIK